METQKININNNNNEQSAEKNLQENLANLAVLNA